jgi:cation transport ATPase
MGGIGSDAAMESADVVLMGDDLTALPYAIALAQRARRVVIQNLVIACRRDGAARDLGCSLASTRRSARSSSRSRWSGHEGSTVVVILERPAPAAAAAARPRCERRYLSAVTTMLS